MLKKLFSNSNSKKSGKSFWNAIKPFFTNRGIIANDSITFEENVVLKNDPKEATEVFNNSYINIVETTSGKWPSSIGSHNSQYQDRATIKKSLNLTKIIPLLQP